MSSVASTLPRRLGLVTASGHLPMHFNSVALMLAVLSASALGQLTWVIAARIAPAREVGLASGAIAAMILCGQVALMGFGSAVIALLPEYRDREAELLVSTVGAVTLAGLGLACAFLLLASRAFHELSVVTSSPLYALAFLAMGALWTIFLLLEPTSTAFRRGDQVLVRNVVAGVLRVGVLLLVAVVVGSATSFVIFLAWVLSIAAGCVLGYGQLAKWMSSSRVDVRRCGRVLHSALRIGIPNYALDLAFMAPGLVLPILITELLSPTQNAYWYIAWALAGLAFLGPHYVAMALFAEASHRPDWVAVGSRQAVTAALVLGVLAAAFLTVAVQWILPIVGSAYATEGATPLRIMAWAVVPLAFLETYLAVCRVRRHLREATLVCACLGVLAVCGAAVLGPRYGLAGVAVAWLGSQALGGGVAAVRLPALAGERSHA